MKTRTERLNYGQDGEIEIIYNPMRRIGPWGLLPGQSPSGYGPKVPTDWVVYYAKRRRRVYCTIYSNVGTCWFLYQGKKMIVG